MPRKRTRFSRLRAMGYPGRGLLVALPLLVGLLTAPLAHASGSALSQLPGEDACVSDSSYPGSLGTCRQAVGLGLIQSIAISPDDKSLYTAAVGSDAVAAFSRDMTSGLLTQVPGGAGCIQDPSATAEPGCTQGEALQIPDWVTVSPSGTNVYASAAVSQAVDVFTRDTTSGGLTQPSGTAGCISSSSPTPCAAGTGLQGPGVIQLSPDGKNAYVALFGNNLSNTGGVAIFSVGSGGSLTQLSGGNGCILDKTSAVAGCTSSPDSVLRGVGSVAISPDGKFVYAAARVSETVTVYARDSTTGALTRVPGAGGCVEED